MKKVSEVIARTLDASAFVPALNADLNARVSKRRERASANADKVLRALSEAGYVVAPVEPTKKMKVAGERCVLRGGAGDFIGDKSCVTMSAAINADEAGIIYRAMLNASREKE